MTARAGRGARRVACLVLAGSAAACGGDSPTSGGPRAAALRVFDLARSERPAPEELEAVFGHLGEPARAALDDTLARLAAVAGPPRLERTTAAFEQTVCDFVAPLPGGGQSSVAIVLAPDEGGAWRVRSIWGPGLDWPSAPRPRGTGLSSSERP